MDQSAAGKPLELLPFVYINVCLCAGVCGSRTVTVPLGGRVGHGVHRVYAGRLHAAVGNRHLWVLQQKKREIDLCQFVLYICLCLCVFVFTHMPPKDPVQQAASGWLWRLIPV